MDDNEYKRLLDAYNNDEKLKQSGEMVKLNKEVSELKQRLNYYEHLHEEDSNNIKKLQNLQQKSAKKSKDYDSKFGIGFIFGMFLGLIGLFFVFMYSDDPDQKSSFIKGWLTSFIIGIAIALIAYFVLYASLMDAYSNIYNYY